MSSTSRQRAPELVLVGGGHAHVQLLRAFAMAPPPARLTVVLDTPIAIYSGMTPGFIAGQYRRHELEIDVVPLARRCGARLVLSPAVGIDARAGRVELAGRPPLPYDLISFDIGSTVLGLDLPGVRQHAVPTRPIAGLVHRFEALVRAARESGQSGRPYRVAVVGAGAGGIELAFTAGSRLRTELGAEIATTVVTSADRPLAEYPQSLSRRVERRAHERGIEIVCGRRVERVEAGRLLLEDGDSIAADVIFWVTGAAAHPLFDDSALARDERGFLSVRPTLQAVGDDTVFAAGDCATLVEDPPPKAGVYAVRQGPFLEHNLRAALGRQPLRAYRPQRDFLTLLNLGDGTAIGAKWGRVIEGAWVMRWKDRIDRRFMRRFQVLAPDGALEPEFAGHEMAAEDPMFCGGCAAKVGPAALESALARLPPAPADDEVSIGLGAREDVAAYRTPGGERVFTSLDAFRAFTDDPWLVGRVAANNAISDLVAKGVTPRFALALVTVPAVLDGAGAEEALFQALAGVRTELDREGVQLIGGHSTLGSDLLVGLTVDGFLANVDARFLPLAGLEPGDALVLTKPLGTGVVLHADMQGRCDGRWLEATLAHLLHGNREAARIAVEVGAHAATDVTGFGLAGHARDLARASRVCIELELSALPALPGALELLRLGLRSTSHAQNRAVPVQVPTTIEGAIDAAERTELAFDPQTAGGLLIGVEGSRSGALLTQLHAAGCTEASVVGTVLEPDPGDPGGAVLLVP